MSNRLTYKLVTQLGWCCLWQFLHDKRRISTTKVAAYLGVDARSIRRLRQRVREGQITPCNRCDQAAKPHFTIEELPSR